MTATARRSEASIKGRPKRPSSPLSLEEKRTASLLKANRAKRRIGDLKADARAHRLGPEALLADPRARDVKVLVVLQAIPRCTLERCLDALLACQINGARICGQLTPEERRALAAALSQTGRGTAVPPAAAVPGLTEGTARGLDLELQTACRLQPVVELAPSEFAAARAGLEADPQLLLMVDRLVDAVRLYAERDDGGVRARVVAEQWIRFRNYRAKVAAGEYPPSSICGPAVLE